MAGNNFREGVIDAARTAFCNFANDTVNFGHWFYRTTAPGFLPRPDQLPQQPLLGGGLAGLVCGNLPSQPLPPDEILPFTGGQCVDTRYSYTLEYVVNGATEISSQDLALTGVVNGTAIETSGATKQLVIYHRGGDSRTVVRGVGAQFGMSVTSFALREPINGPDNCGNPTGSPTPPPAPGSNDVDTDVEYDDGNGPIVIPVNIVFAYPQVDIDGTLVVPFNVSGVEFALNGDINVTTGDIDFNFGGGSPLSDLCCLADIFDDVVPDLPTDDPPENEEFFPRIVAVVVTTTTINDGTKVSTIGQQNGPNFYHPRLGNIHFNIGRRGKKVWVRDISVRNEREYVPCPVDYGAIEVLGDPVTGVSWQITPIYRRVIETEFPE